MAGGSSHGFPGGVLLSIDSRFRAMVYLSRYTQSKLHDTNEKNSFRCLSNCVDGEREKT